MTTVAPVHLPGTPGASLVQTGVWQAATAAITQAVDNRDVVVVSGPVGVGKTFTVASVCAGRTELVVARNMSARPKARELAVGLYRAVTGVRPAERTPAWALTADLVEHLSDPPRVLIVDEADNLHDEGMRQLRFLRNELPGRFALVLIGAHADQHVRKRPELASVVARWVRLDPLTDDDVVTTMRAYHPAFATTPERVLRDVNRRWCRGNFRRWARILETLLTTYGPHAALTRDTADVVLAYIGADTTEVAA